MRGVLRLGMVLFWRGRGTGNTTRGVSKYLRRRWRSRDSPIGGPVRVTVVFLVRNPIPCTLFGGSRLRSGSFINASPREGCRLEIQSLGFSLNSDRSPRTLQRHTAAHRSLRASGTSFRHKPRARIALPSCMKTAAEAYHLCAERGASLCKAPSWVLVLQSTVSPPTLESAPLTRDGLAFLFRYALRPCAPSASSGHRDPTSRHSSLRFRVW